MDRRQAGMANMQPLALVFLAAWMMVWGCFGRFPESAETISGTKPARMKLALIHFAAAHKQPQKNLTELVRLNRRAAESGASLILNTEMAVSGYSFNSREDIAPYTETDHGLTIQAMGELAAAYGVYIGIAFAERDPATGIFYNAAFVLGPGGRVIAKYHKVLTERRWARSGSAIQQGVADTPWGRVGMAICADSYSGLIARTMALKGVDLLWVPANWPTVGGLDPTTVWRARVFENGFYLAACNRTGKDLTLDCTGTVSCVLDPNGKTLFSGSSETSRVFLIDLPLDSNGKWADVRRVQKMQEREISYYRPIYLQPWVEDFTGFYKLPQPGLLQIHCLVPPESGMRLDGLSAQIEKHRDGRPALWVLPPINDNTIEKGRLAAIAAKYQVALAVSFISSNTATQRVLITPDGTQPFIDAADPETPVGDFPFKILHFGPAAMAMVPVDTFAHPELATALSKLGCDLVILTGDMISAEGFLLSRIKALAGVAVAACANNGAQITGVHDRHFNWDQKGRERPGICTYTLDTTKTRQKLFHENIDYDRLLANPNLGLN